MKRPLCFLLGFVIVHSSTEILTVNASTVKRPRGWEKMKVFLDSLPVTLGDKPNRKLQQLNLEIFRYLQRKDVSYGL